ncbi:MAG: ATP-binding protein [Spirochaetales bacterium]|nr:ATP-binding protein [Spirochaetales bacterium]MCF7937159.1 ATP-binding protein [Spirochaetales bacterium]
MKQVGIISGKGGTGKTVLTASLATLAENAVFADCDVDASDLHLLLQPKVTTAEDFAGGEEAVIDPVLCTGCRECLDVCRFDALSMNEESVAIVDSYACEGCRTCSLVCPENAVSMQRKTAGQWFRSESSYGPMLHARLIPGEDNSGKLVTKVKNEAKSLAVEKNKDWILVDGPPGIGCPVLSALAELDYVIVITEPTPSGYHDLNRVAEVIKQFRIRAGVVINKHDLNPETASEIEALAGKLGFDMAGKIPFSRNVGEAIRQGVPYIKYAEDEVSRAILSVWETIQDFLFEERVGADTPANNINTKEQER